MIPVKLLTQIGASIGDRVWLRGTTQDRIQVDLYWIWLQIGGHPPLYLDVIGDRVGGEAILGRDVLNQLIVTLNGLAATVEISD